MPRGGRRAGSGRPALLDARGGGGTLKVCLSLADRERLQALAIAEGVSASAWAARVIGEAISRLPPRAGREAASTAGHP